MQNKRVQERKGTWTEEDLEKPKKKRRKSLAKSINKIGVAGYEYPLITEDMYNLLIDKRTFKSGSKSKSKGLHNHLHH